VQKKKVASGDLFGFWGETLKNAWRKGGGREQWERGEKTLKNEESWEKMQKARPHTEGVAKGIVMEGGVRFFNGMPKKPLSGVGGPGERRAQSPNRSTTPPKRSSREARWLTRRGREFPCSPNPIRETQGGQKTSTPASIPCGPTTIERARFVGGESCKMSWSC